MITGGLAKQISTMHLRDKMSPEQIAQALRLDVAVVAANLAVKAESEGMSRSVKEKLKDGIRGLEELAITALQDTLENTDECAMHLRLSASKFVVEVGLGKHDGAVSNQQPSNVGQINVLIQNGLSRYEEMQQRYQADKHIDQPTVTQTVNI